MAKYDITPLTPNPDFDMMYFMEVAGETRIDGDMLEDSRSSGTSGRPRASRLMN
jgi:hypothetical protein